MNIRLKFMVVTAAIVLLPLHPAFSAQIGQGAQQDNSLEGRIAQLQQRVEERPRDPDLHFELSKLYEEDVGRYYDEALSEFESAVDNGLKGKTVIWNPLGTKLTNTGVALVKSEKYDEAIKSFELAKISNPDHPILYNNFAQAYKGKKVYDEAIKYMKKAIDFYRSESGFYESIGIMYLENKEFRLGLLNLNRNLLLNPENEKINWSISKAHYGLKQYDKAIEAIDKLPHEWRRNDTVKAFRKECVGLLNN